MSLTHLATRDGSGFFIDILRHQCFILAAGWMPCSEHMVFRLSSIRLHLLGANSRMGLFSAAWQAGSRGVG